MIGTGRNALREKKNGGFTLAELLIVVAIVVVLVIISIPIFADKLEAARKATCDSNRRALKAEMSVDELSNDELKSGVIYEAELAEKHSKNFDFETFCPEDGNIMAVINKDDATKATGGTKMHVFCSVHDWQGDWETGMEFEVNELMTSNGYIFRCLRKHTSGTTSRTRDPSLRSNKSTWEVIGYTGDTLPYSSTVRYAVGLQVSYKGNYYERTSFNLVGGQVPYEGKDSDYWKFIGPATL